MSVRDERIFNSILFLLKLHSRLSSPPHSTLFFPRAFILASSHLRNIFTFKSIILSQWECVLCFLIFFIHLLISPRTALKTKWSICFFRSFTLVDFSLLASFFFFALFFGCQRRRRLHRRCCCCWFFFTFSFPFLCRYVKNHVDLKSFFIVLFSRELTGKNKQK